MRFKIEPRQLEKVEQLIEYLKSKGVEADTWGVEARSMSGHVVTNLIVEIQVPADE